MAEKFQLFLLFFPPFLFSLAFHESAHGWVAKRFGDDTAEQLGRITLNPLPHMDFIGTFLLPLATFFAPAGIIPIGGWGKPVPVDYRRLRAGRRSVLWVAAAGPISNLILAVIFSLLMRLLLLAAPNLEGTSLFRLNLLSSVFAPLYAILQMGIWINLGLAFFNLIPLHPLDGGKVMEGLLPARYLATYNRIARFGILIIFAAFYFGLLDLLRIPITFFARWLIPT